jgi:curli production assembly/transport component CsgG
MTSLFRLLLSATVAASLSACGTSASRLLAEQPTLAPVTESINDLHNLPPPKQKLFAAVFAFQDQTGQHKQNDNYADYSFAVTQGGASILINAMRDAGRGHWFGVLERNRLGDLLQERQIIRANRAENPGEDGKALPPIGPLLNAGILLEGGIIGYDTNVLTGGIGATFLGIGASIQYRRDNVAVYLRAISVVTGEVLVSVTTDKTIYSNGVSGLLNRYVGFNKLLQAEAGVTTNEPGELAVRQAIEKAVYAIILDGAAKGVWSFADDAQAQGLIQDYIAARDGKYPLSTSSDPPPKVISGGSPGTMMRGHQS